MDWNSELRKKVSELVTKLAKFAHFSRAPWWKIAKKTIGWSDFNAHFMEFSFFLFADFVKNNAAAVSRKNSTTSRKSSVNNKPNTTTTAASSKHLIKS